MAYRHLINITDIQRYRQTSRGANTEKINHFIREAQEIDLAGLMGKTFFNDLMNNSQDTNYQRLLNGDTYTYDGDTYTFEGIKAVLAYYAYARLLLFGNATAMPHDIVQKTNEWSDPISSSQRRDMEGECKAIARKYWADCLHFLKAVPGDYPAWDGACVTKTRLKVEKI